MKKSKLSRLAALLAAGALLLGGVFMSCSSDDDDDTPETVAVTGVSIKTPAKTTISVGETLTLTATVLPENATDKIVTWKSNTEKVATVDAGVVKGLSAGTAEITATAGGVESEVVTVTVLAVGSLEGTIY